MPQIMHCVRFPDSTHHSLKHKKNLVKRWVRFILAHQSNITIFSCRARNSNFLFIYLIFKFWKKICRTRSTPPSNCCLHFHWVAAVVFGDINVAVGWLKCFKKVVCKLCSLEGWITNWPLVVPGIHGFYFLCTSALVSMAHWSSSRMASQSFMT